MFYLLYVMSMIILNQSVCKVSILKFGIAEECELFHKIPQACAYL